MFSRVLPCGYLGVTMKSQGLAVTLRSRPQDAAARLGPATFNCLPVAWSNDSQSIETNKIEPLAVQSSKLARIGSRSLSCVKSSFIVQAPITPFDLDGCMSIYRRIRLDSIQPHTLYSLDKGVGWGG